MKQQKQTLFLLVDAMLLHAIAKFDPSVATLKAKECIFRINRDVRFSKDKSPYKSQHGCILLTREEKK